MTASIQKIDRNAAQAQPRYERLTDIVANLARILAAGWGVVYAIVGVAGLLDGGLSPFTGTDGAGHFLGLRVNGLAGLIYLAVAAAALASAVRTRTAERFLGLLFVFGLVLFIGGIFLSNSADHNWIAADGNIVGLGMITMIGATW